MSQQINLFNPVFTRQGKYFSTVMMVQGLGMLALVSALGCGFLYYQTEQAKSQFVAFKSQQEKLQKFDPRAGVRKTKAELEAEYKQLQAESQQQMARFSTYMRTFSRHALEGVWLSRITLESRPDQLHLSLKGNALYPELVTHYLQQLGREPLLSGFKVNIPSLEKQSATASQYVSFELDVTGKAAAK